MNAQLETQPNPADPFSAMTGYVAHLKALDEEKLFAEWRQQFGLFAEPLLRAAAVWREFKERKYDMSQLQHEARALFIPQIAAGTVKAELVVKFKEKRDLLKKLARLTPDEQQEHIDGKPIPFVEKTATGAGAKRMIPIALMEPAHLKQVYDAKAGAIRSEQEQIVLLAAPKPEVKPPRTAKSGKFLVDIRQKRVWIDDKWAKLSDAIDALRKAGQI